SRRSLGKRGAPVGLDFQRQNNRNPLALSSDQRIRLYIHQRIAPGEHSVQGGHRPSGGVVRPSWFDLPLLEQRQLLAKEEILRRQGTAGMHRERSEPHQVDDGQRQRPEAVGNGTENR
ncbi:MAG TPA: hypothetical protein VKL40_06180, partial [Candidatus Angelobacter sp.]|nr:hypothetical protein [Candidatus Angelobacter sp.]